MALYTLQYEKVTMLKELVTEEVPAYIVTANNIKVKREEKGMTQEELANKIKMTRVNLTNIELGNHKITISVLEKICEVFGCKSSELLPF